MILKCELFVPQCEPFRTYFAPVFISTGCGRWGVRVGHVVGRGLLGGIEGEIVM